MPIFISYNHEDAEFADRLARNLVNRRHQVWIDKWELNVGDSLIDKIQGALTASSAILVLLSKHSVASEWCKKELNSGLVRELSEKKILLLPCVLDDCEIPLFLREKLYADFRKDPDKALHQVDDALMRITNRQQGRLESPDFHTDWAFDWKQGPSGTWYFEWMFVDHGNDIEYCILTRCQMACNEVASALFQTTEKEHRQEYIRGAFTLVVAETTKRKLKIRLRDAFEKFETFQVRRKGEERWLVEISSRRMGIDNGKDTLIHVDQILERASAQMRPDQRSK